MCSNGKKTAVDWTALAENQDAMIDSEYLPDNFTFCDPSRMKKNDYFTLLQHWYERQEDKDIETTFAFKGYWDSSNELVVIPKHKKSNRKTTGKTGASRQRPGPPGVRKGEKGWSMDSDVENENSGYEDEGEGEDEDTDGDEDDDPKGPHKRSKVPPTELPFSAQRIVRPGAKGSRKVTTSTKGKAAMPSKSRNKQVGQDDEPEVLATKKRPQPKPAYRGAQSTALTPVVAAQPAPKKARKPRQLSQQDLGPQYERPVTRNTGKHTADDAGLQAAGKSSAKRAKKGTKGKGD
jgi:hypothetical protein